MNLGQLANILTDNAKSYRNSKLVTEIVPQLLGQPINEPVVRQMIEPFITQVDLYLPDEVQQIMRNRLERFVPDAQAHVRASSHMNQAVTDQVWCRKPTPTLSLRLL